jgi:transcriptional regulator with XRE-family HTH domain
MEFAARLRALMDSRALGVRALARQLPCDPGLISRLVNGKQRPSADIAQRLDDVLGARGELVALASASALAPPLLTGASTPADDEIAALELARQAAASEVGAPTVEALELAVDDLAVAYHGTAPAALLDRARSYLDYTGRLSSVKATLGEHRRLLISGGWLSLLAATCLIDLHHDRAAAAHLRTAAQLARETEHPEIAAWCLETRAWQLLISDDYKQAIQVAQGAQRVAPRGSSAYIQATAQEGRAWARLNAPAETRDALTRVERLVAPLPMPDRPEHHYRYDPAKSQAYVATTLSWLGDPAAEDQARQFLARLETTTDGSRRPRRAASTRLDLSLALVATGRHDEAAGTALEAITSGRLVPSHHWRAREVIKAVAQRGVPEAAELDEAYRAACR